MRKRGSLFEEGFPERRGRGGAVELLRVSSSKGEIKSNVVSKIYCVNVLQEVCMYYRPLSGRQPYSPTYYYVFVLLDGLDWDKKSDKYVRENAVFPITIFNIHGQNLTELLIVLLVLLLVAKQSNKKAQVDR